MARFPRVRALRCHCATRATRVCGATSSTLIRAGDNEWARLVQDHLPATLQLLEDVGTCVNKYNLWLDSSSLNPEESAKLYDENLELAKCLREKGLNVPDPSQQEPKVDLSGLKESKDDIMPLLQECGWQK